MQAAAAGAVAPAGAVEVAWAVVVLAAAAAGAAGQSLVAGAADPAVPAAAAAVAGFAGACGRRHEALHGHHQAFLLQHLLEMVLQHLATAAPLLRFQPAPTHQQQQSRPAGVPLQKPYHGPPGWAEPSCLLGDLLPARKMGPWVTWRQHPAQLPLLLLHFPLLPVDCAGHRKDQH